MSATTELLTADELAQRLRVRPATVRSWGRQGRIPRVRISAKVIRYDAAEVIGALARRGGDRSADDDLLFPGEHH